MIVLPAQSMFEHFAEKLADGTLEAEPLSHVVTLHEEEQQDLKKPEPSRQYILQIDSKLTITTKGVIEPSDEKGLRLKYAILTNLRLLAQMRQQGRSIYKDLDRCTFNDFLDTLLDKDNSNIYKEVDGRRLITPSWTFCLSYEFELRKEAITRDPSCPLDSASERRASHETLAAADRNPQLPHVPATRRCKR